MLKNQAPRDPGRSTRGEKQQRVYSLPCFDNFVKQGVGA
jgi:hypothetical protein